MMLNTLKIKSVKTYQNKFFWILWIFFDLIIACNYMNADYPGYKIMYDTSYKGQYWLEFGYWTLEKFFSRIGVSFFTFRFVFVSIAYMLVGLTILYFSNKPSIVLILYSIFPLVLENIQIRNFMASAICLYSLRFLEKKGRKNYIYYVICILLASLIHVASLFFLLVCVIRFFNIRIIRNLSFCSSILGYVFVSVFRSFIADIVRAVAGIGISEQSQGIFLWLVFGVGIEVVIATLARNFKTDERSRFLISISYISCVYIPLMILTFDFYRVYRNLILINYICLFQIGYTNTNLGLHHDKEKKRFLLNLKKKIPDKNFFVVIISFLYSLMLFYVQLSPRNVGNYEFATRPLLEKNYFLEFLKGLIYG